ncbi:molybdenum ABC transporter ATP-binding protein [Aureimonas mangrovi]|uniref:molybdenum ABC transporter ATP-binding protein n=1 Tax=Aureimonas mangrovi TaxID=2758041 RepID=UPI00163D48AD|nr:molybdenum ABC transporter ATP-binding protein [Aureimonas mangrovi]
MADLIDVKLAGRLGNFDLDTAFQAPMRGITALFGPSGCGKTTILRALAGLQRLEGHILVGDEDWQRGRSFLPTHRRAVGYVFQEASLFPHLSVRRNLTYGQRRAKGADHAIRFDDVVELLGLSRLVDREPAHLSGGERQRVSIGRALLSQPRLLLMDEPLAALDRMAKDEILPYFEALHAELRIPILLVSHDIAEVERLADHLVLMREGRVVSSGPVNEALTARGSPLGLRRDLASILPGTVSRTDTDGILVLDVLGQEILTVGSGFAPGAPVRVRIAAGDVSLTRSAAVDTSILNKVPVRVTGIEPLGEAEAHVYLALGEGAGADFVARLTRRSLNSLKLAEGETATAQIKAVSLLASR